MIHPDTELRFISPEMGYGVFATKKIPKGTITWVPDDFDIKISDDELAAMRPEHQDTVYKYGYRENTGAIVIGWDFSKYVNHSFRPNCMSTPYEFEVAIKDIHPGDELTDDYGTLNVIREFKCFPEPGIERQSVRPDDLKRHHAEWDVHLQSAFAELHKQEQPMAKFVSAEAWERALLTSKGHLPFQSILTCLYPGYA